jgi:hypothetical protein
VNVEGDGAVGNVVGDGALTKAAVMKIKGFLLGVFLERIYRLEVKVQEHTVLIDALQMDLGSEETRRDAATAIDTNLATGINTNQALTNPALTVYTNPVPIVCTNRAADLPINRRKAPAVNTNPEPDWPSNRRKMLYLQKKKQELIKKRERKERHPGIFDSNDETEFEGVPKDPPLVASEKQNNFELPQFSSGHLKDPPRAEKPPQISPDIDGQQAPISSVQLNNPPQAEQLPPINPNVDRQQALKDIASGLIRK